jgi:hypothetical protein
LRCEATFTGRIHDEDGLTGELAEGYFLAMVIRERQVIKIGHIASIDRQWGYVARTGDL